MKHSVASILVLPLMVSLIGCSNNHNDQSFSKVVNIYSLNDTHGDFLRDKDTGTRGFDSISGLLKKDYQTNPKDSSNITICLGDMFQGQFVSDYTHGQPIVDALNYLNCQAFVIGNHEFDWGLEEMYRYKDGDLSNGELNCDFIAANIIQKDINKRPDWIKPYVIIEQDGHKIGIIGFMGEGIENTILPGKLDNYKITECMPLYKQYYQELTEVHHCDLIAAAVHDYKDIYQEFAKCEVPCHTIFGAHTHKMELDYIQNNKLPFKVPFIQAGCDNQAVSKVTYTYNHKKVIEKVDATHLINDHPDDYLDSELTHLFDGKYQDAFNKSNQVIAENFPKMTKEQWAHFVSKALYQSQDYPSDVGVINFAGVRNGTDFASSSTLYFKQILRVLPYANQIFHLKINKDVFDEFVAKNKTNCFEFNPIQTTNDYYLVNVIDFVYNLPDEQDLWSQATKLNTFDLKIRDYTINYIQNM